MLSIDHANSGSLSNALMSGITTWRNYHNTTDVKIKAEIGYGLITNIALVESVVAAFFCAASALLLPFGYHQFENSFDWLRSSSFCLFCSTAACFLNPFVNVIEYEGHPQSGYESFRFTQRV